MYKLKWPFKLTNFSVFLVEVQIFLLRTIWTEKTTTKKKYAFLKVNIKGT